MAYLLWSWWIVFFLTYWWYCNHVNFWLLFSVGVQSCSYWSSPWLELLFSQIAVSLSVPLKGFFFTTNWPIILTKNAPWWRVKNRFKSDEKSSWCEASQFPIANTLIVIKDLRILVEDWRTLGYRQFIRPHLPKNVTAYGTSETLSHQSTLIVTYQYLGT